MRKCHTKECNADATHALVWTEGWVFYCFEHALGMANLGRIVDFPAAQTLRNMTVEEMLDDQQQQASDE